MKILLLTLSLIFISCGKNNVVPNHGPIQETQASTTLEQKSELQAQMSFVTLKGGVVQTGIVEFAAMDIEDAESFRLNKQVSGEVKAASHSFVLYAKDLNQRMDLVEKFADSDFTQAEIVIDLKGSLTGHWGWLDSTGALTWNEKIKKADGEKLVLKITDKARIREILQHRLLPSLKLNDREITMAKDEFASLKVHALVLKQTQEFDHSLELKEETLTRLKTYSIHYSTQTYSASLRYKDCVWVDSGDVGGTAGRRDKRMQCSEKRCDVRMQQVVEASREEIENNNVLNFDQNMHRQKNWFYGYAGDSMRLNSSYGTQVVSVGMISQGSCAGKEMIDGFPGTSQKNIAPRKVVQFKSYLLL